MTMLCCLMWLFWVVFPSNGIKDVIWNFSFGLKFSMDIIYFYSIWFYSGCEIRKIEEYIYDINVLYIIHNMKLSFITQGSVFFYSCISKDLFSSLCILNPSNMIKTIKAFIQHLSYPEMEWISYCFCSWTIFICMKWI